MDFTDNISQLFLFINWGKGRIKSACAHARYNIKRQPLTKKSMRDSIWVRRYASKSKFVIRSN
jgi:peptidyl-tRNA hydrolase